MPNIHRCKGRQRVARLLGVRLNKLEILVLQIPLLYYNTNLTFIVEFKSLDKFIEGRSLIGRHFISSIVLYKQRYCLLGGHTTRVMTNSRRH